MTGLHFNLRQIRVTSRISGFNIFHFFSMKDRLPHSPFSDNLKMLSFFIDKIKNLMILFAETDFLFPLFFATVLDRSLRRNAFGYFKASTSAYSV